MLTLCNLPDLVYILRFFSLSSDPASDPRDLETCPVPGPHTVGYNLSLFSSFSTRISTNKFKVGTLAVLSPPKVATGSPGLRAPGEPDLGSFASARLIVFLYID